ncbi:37S ribosomal protein S22 [Yarrowia sp. C11]|nr:37S ribosomal protein S22 [Yarrowia sp. C11]
MDELKNAMNDLATEDQMDPFKNNFPEEEDVRPERHHPDTLAARSAQTFTVPKHLDHAVAEALRDKVVSPSTLKRNVAQFFAGSDELVSKMETGRDNLLDSALTVAAATLHQNYGAAYAVLKEVRQKMPEGWTPDSVLDIGLGASSGMLAVNELFSDVESWDPDRKTAVILGPKVNTVLTKQFFDTQKHEDQGQNNFKDKVRNTRIQTGLPKSNQYKYDLIIANQQLDLLARQAETTLEAFSARLVDLLSPGGILVLVDRGNPNGYERIARAREVLIRPMEETGPTKTPVPFGKTRRMHFSSDAEMKKLKQELGPDFEIEDVEIPEEERVYLHIVAPCSHHGKCPFQQGQLRQQNTSKGSWCAFTQKLGRPEYVMQLKRGKTLASSWDPKVTRNKNKFSGGGRPGSSDLEVPSFSYLIVQRSTKPETPIPKEQMWPRILKPPMKKKNHVIMNICGPEGGLYSWTVTKGQGKQEYLDARKAHQRDQWALEAKVKTPVRKNYQLAVENEKISRIPSAQENINKKSTLSTNQRRDLIQADRRRLIKRTRKEAKLGGKESEEKDEDDEDEK